MLLDCSPLHSIFFCNLILKKGELKRKVFFSTDLEKPTPEHFVLGINICPQTLIRFKEGTRLVLIHLISKGSFVLRPAEKLYFNNNSNPGRQLNVSLFPG